MNKFAVGVAALGALAHLYFVYVEMLTWRLATVRRIAPRWLEGLDEQVAKSHVKWAKPLAANVGAYNLVLAIGLATTAWAYATGNAIAPAFAGFMAVWLLVAAAAALATGVFKAFAAQAFFGVLMIVACLRG